MSNDFTFSFQQGIRLDDPGKQAAIDRLFASAVQDIADYAEGRAKWYAPRRTGTLQRSITHTPVVKTGNVFSTHLSVGAAYGKWVEFGTGLFGPRRRRIYPRTGNVLSWKLFNRAVRPGQETRVFARSVAGQKPQRFVSRAYQDTARLYVPGRTRVLAEEVAKVIAKN